MLRKVKDEVKEKDEPKKLEKTKRRISVVIIVIFVIGLLLGIAGTVCLYEFTDFRGEGHEVDDKNNDKEEKKTPEKEQSRDLTTDEQKDLLKVIDKLKWLDLYNQDIDEKNQLSSQQLLWFAIQNVDFDYDESVALSDITNFLDTYLLDYDLEIEDIFDWNCDVPLLTYDSKNKTYSYNEDHYGHGGGGMFSSVFNRFASGKVEKDTYTVVVYKAFTNIYDDMGVTYALYPSYSDAENDENEIYKEDIDEVNMDDQMSDEEMMEKLNDADSEDLVKYTYTFVLDDGVYKLKGYKIGE